MEKIIGLINAPLLRFMKMERLIMNQLKRMLRC